MVPGKRINAAVLPTVCDVSATDVKAAGITGSSSEDGNGSAIGDDDDAACDEGWAAEFGLVGLGLSG